MMHLLINKVKRALKKPPKVLAQRIMAEVKGEVDRFTIPTRMANFNAKRLLRLTHCSGIDALWKQLSQNPFPATVANLTLADMKKYCPDNTDYIFERAEMALEKKVNLLGSGEVSLGTDINWQCDYKTGYVWKKKYFKDIDYNVRGHPCDVKFPWELSRLQWMIPVGQAYLLTQKEKYAQFTKEIIKDWIVDNPAGNTVNWSCTMEVAMRIMTFSWLFHAFQQSQAWNDPAFRELFLCNLYRHAWFTERYLEISDINGNHLTADAAALVIAGIFWQPAKVAQKWLDTGWTLLEKEMPLQVTTDGVDFEGSTAYHRLVLELLWFAARARLLAGYSVSEFFQRQLIRMANYISDYSRADGTIPLHGDADDARTLPFGEQSINDHRYLIGLVGLTFDNQTLLNAFTGSNGEIAWHLGIAGLEKIIQYNNQPLRSSSVAYAAGGIYILKNSDDHIFIDCAPIGLAGRGGHGHNDCLSFSAQLCGENLITDCGAYIYTGNYLERNAFRSTASHNTPLIDNEEINRFIHPDYLWNMHYDALPQALCFEDNRYEALFKGSHQGYQRLNDPVSLTRLFVLRHAEHSLLIEDNITGNAAHEIHIPLHLSPEIIPVISADKVILLKGKKQSFILKWSSNANWDFNVFPTRISPSYGVTQPSLKLFWKTKSELPINFKVYISPVHTVKKGNNT